MRHLSRSLLVLAMLGASSALQAQDSQQVAPVAPVVTAAPAPVEAPSASPTVVSPDAAVRVAPAPWRVSTTTLPAKPVAPRGDSFGRPEALIVVGIAAIVGGSLVGGTLGYIVAGGGLLVGLYGLWEYLK